MRLSEAQAWARLAAHDHATLATVHSERGVDAVPVVYAVDDGHVGIPIDLVKPKASSRLQRERNLAADPRAALLIEHWDAGDWSRLWWVRAELRWVGTESGGRDAVLAQRLEERFARYAGQPFARVLVLRVVQLSGWSASGR
ncbi:pyridoxamine 5'-phosphate oxidase family protein [Gordonia caeni]|uniref:TIGR03668 family PPOX class F420-dependent oxidoreductase n=1 Tax=Gordonia caeni TaxID=1007097 RepID=A0ABP7PS49_9ACTN